MPGQNLRTIAMVIVMLAFAGAASSESLSLDWKISHVSPVSGAAFVEKSSVNIRCEWDAAILSTAQWNEPVEWEGTIVVDGTLLHVFKAKYAPDGKWFLKPGSRGDKDFPWEERPVYGTATNQFHGFAEAAWIASGVGTHTVGCRIAAPGAGNPMEPASKQGNNLKQSTITVNPIGQVTPGTFPHPPPKRTPDRSPQKAVQPVLPRPGLTIAGAQAKFDAACANLASLITVQVKIQDAYLALGAGKGTLTITENGGANLSKSEALPAFALNEVKVIQLSIGTSPASVAALPGQHQLRIDLNPQLINGQPSFTKPATAYPLPITLPAGYCSTR